MPAAHHLLHAGYVRDDGVASSVSLVLDGAAVIVVDPGMVADTELILAPLRDLGLHPRDVTHVVITHHTVIPGTAGRLLRVGVPPDGGHGA